MIATAVGLPYQALIGRIVDSASGRRSESDGEASRTPDIGKCCKLRDRIR